MNEETEILLAKAVRRQLTAAEEARWRELCRQDPTLLDTARELTSTADTLQRYVEPAENETPSAIPPAMLQRLRNARREVFEEETRGGVWTRVVNWLESMRIPQGPMLAYAALVAVLAIGGWWIWRASHPNQPVLVMKNLATSADLPIIAPGAETAFTDPTVIWMTLSSQPVSATILSADGGQVLYQASNARPPLAWERLEVKGSQKSLEPGGTYLLRLEQGGQRSERLVTVRTDARELAAWAADSSGGIAQARLWMEQKRPQDALTLSTTLATGSKGPAEDVAELRKAALKASLDEARKNAPNP